MVEKLYKPSQFNCFMTKEDGEILLYNTRTCSLYKITSDYSETIEKQLISKTINENEITFPVLIKDGFFVPNHSDEVAILMKTFNDYYNNTELTIMILPTHKCNCRCVYCYEDFNGEVMTSKTQENIIAFVKQRMRNCTSLHVSWFGGEPLVAMDVIRNLSLSFIEICKSEKKRYSADITTNGTLLNIDTFRELQKLRVITFQITVDGTKEIHDMQRPLVNNDSSSYDLIVKNLLKLKTEVKSYGFRVYLRINLTKKTFLKIEDFIWEMDKMFGNDSRFQMSFDLAQDWGGVRIESFKDSILTNDDEIENLYEQIKNVVKSTTLSTTDGYEEMSIAAGCYVSQNNYFTIDSSGRITKCAQETRYNISSIGDLSNSIVIDDFEIAKWDSLNRIEIPDKCKKCFLLPRGCFRRSNCTLQLYVDKYLNNQAIAEPSCPGLKTNINDYLVRWSYEGKAKQLQ